MSIIGAQPSSSLLLARRAFEAGDAAGAAELAREVATGPGRSPEALMLWGVAAAEAGDFPGALAPLRRAIRQSGGSAGQRILLDIQLGRALIASGRWREGLTTLQAVERSPPADPGLRRRLGLALLGAGRVEAALPHLKFAAETRASDADSQVDLAWALAALGEREEAQSFYERAIALAPDFGRAHAGLSTLQRWSEKENHTTRLRALLARAESAALRAEVGYALFKELDDLGRREEAWEALTIAHASAIAVDPWSPEVDAAFTDAMIQRFPAGLLRKPATASRPASGPCPIFVMGLPRTGTTLVERILSAHSQVAGLGELPFLPIAFREAAGASAFSPISAKTVHASRKIDWRQMGAAYLREAASLATGAERFVDKLPFNSHFVGAIRLALPEATLVLVERDAMDCLWSAHRNPFQLGGWYGWTRRQDDLIAHYANHRRLMDHWRDALGESLIVARYEDLVTDPQSAILSLLERCGLAPEAACFHPQGASGAVLTLSQAAARGPIASSAIGAWRPYADKLAPLRRRLGELGVVTT